MRTHVKRFHFYKTKYTLESFDDIKVKHLEFNILPMFRYLNFDKALQFRWFIWGITIKLK